MTPADTPSASQLSRAALLHTLHDEGRILILPNAWDAVSARVVEESGAAAIATTSAGVAWSLGARDGGGISSERALDVARSIVAAVDLPVSVDIEAGYADLAVTVAGVIRAGGVGINLEDARDGALLPLAEGVANIALARATAEEAGLPLFINARIDTFFKAHPTPLAEAITRAHAYLAAGASGIFVPGVTDPETIAALVREIPAPVNIMAEPGSPSVPELAALGVRRVSAGSSIAQAAYALVQDAATEMLTAGTYDTVAGMLDYARLNAVR
ncbi:isocitrate lyase/PEP mutase family protein [Mycetocola spongiae]|uniref:isocitrate lyase/PEP mutase family protein n=1 Tax=Mycetocola spongiae TaxID=2859226 RepID=UPI001CF2BF45|nr:isocitrate lyase/phosphoenolpyruvate mutase family protein [Mycetocola spongiae]UCR87909.1 isocitrate lyase/phosphoenolpyruvate mutase family protein [Mycetocola spongiae]